MQPVQSEVLRICRQACLQRARPAKPLKPGRDLGVIQVGMVTTARADELELIGIAAFHPAVHDGDRLTPQARRPSMARLASSRKCHATPDVNSQPRITGTALATRNRSDFRTASPPRTGRDSLI